LVITYYPPISGDFGRWITGSPAFIPPQPTEGGGELDGDETPDDTGSTPGCDNGIEGDFDCDGNVSMEEMMRLADQGSGESDGPQRPSCDNGIEGDYDCDGNVSMEEMMRLADEQAGDEGATAPEGTPAPAADQDAASVEDAAAAAP
jgi:hypothetical protein